MKTDISADIRLSNEESSEVTALENVLLEMVAGGEAVVNAH